MVSSQPGPPRVQIDHCLLILEPIDPTSRGKGKAGKQFMLALAGRKRVMLHERAGLQFPVGRIKRKMSYVTYNHKTSITSAVYLAAVLEYLIAELLELSGNAARAHERKRITPRFLLLAISNDDELMRLLPNNKVIIAQGGVAPKIHPVLLFTRAAAGFEALAARGRRPKSEKIKREDTMSVVTEDEGPDSSSGSEMW
ncbi:hypothetical protein MD484_g920, partial [Candolleomyces efflorescens]